MFYAGNTDSLRNRIFTFKFSISIHFPYQCPSLARYKYRLFGSPFYYTSSSLYVIIPRAEGKIQISQLNCWSFITVATTLISCCNTKMFKRIFSFKFKIVYHCKPKDKGPSNLFYPPFFCNTKRIYRLNVTII